MEIIVEEVKSAKEKAEANLHESDKLVVIEYQGLDHDENVARTDGNLGSSSSQASSGGSYYTVTDQIDQIEEAYNGDIEASNGGNNSFISTPISTDEETEKEANPDFITNGQNCLHACGINPGGMRFELALMLMELISVCARKRKTFVLVDGGSVYGFGWMGFWSLRFPDRGASDKVMKPRILDSLRGHRVSQISIGLYHTVAVTHQGRMFGFRDNERA
ncbi:Regulator of chromosome condensation 1/beta-lactamase-inhibitor protein II [Corchorus capsularis]|uniref:Regulator of chromosome condensation 1/beta-lactamase-inhibitor protein II n=1 Tax=Corchorus capsularis TaxID=210143 RepID=A0A1R3IPW0_COCAP|nr:Regulator of chromosome condensation 1/beta-lactamase-inhibitor protein II [Corchorus capsularis]